MNSVMILGTLGFLACGIGMLFGGFIALQFKGANRKYIPVIFSLCSGMIFGLVLLDIIPESIQLGGYLATFVGLISGVFLFRYVHKINHLIAINIRNRLASTGLIMAVSIAIHNFPSGIALGASSHGALTTSMVSAIALHTIPEGIAVFTPLFVARFKSTIIMPISLIVALPVGLGAIIGALAGIRAPFLLSFIISISMGIILLVTTKEILGDALSKAHILICFTMLVLGFAIIGQFF